MMHEKLLEFWQKAASDLGLQLISPFCLLLGSGHQLDAIVLIKQFGATKGMLVFGDYQEVAPYVDEVVAAGYGFSVLDEPLKNEEYNKEEYVDLLKDWGWSGEKESSPDWL